MAFDSFRGNEADEEFEKSALTEDSLRLALSKLGGKNEQKRSRSSKARSSSPPARRKFVEEDSVVVEKLPSRLSLSSSRIVGGLGTLRAPKEKKEEDGSEDLLSDLKAQLKVFEKRQKVLEERQSDLENALEEMRMLLKRKNQAVSRYDEEKISENVQEKVKIKKTQEKILSASDEELSAAIPIKLKEDADPVEWWKA
ncbi:hypothetical protein FAI40_08450 [Acetobacteraceae bacterium]|nr:hypothetical protein FAI40_08450 [Acetobacteraceae bacterium]